jgi:hypothetical protein
MKKIFLSLLFFLISTTFFAQGIAVQGIARDDSRSAIKDELLTFNFSITSADGTETYYKERQNITTDHFGVFSHIVSSGSRVGEPKFNEIDFEIENLRLKVVIDSYANQPNIEVYNQTFQYTPYAFYAKKAGNGVPTGTILPFMGLEADVPEGWLLCDGETPLTIPSPLHTLLNKLVSYEETTTPDLKGRFLKGIGQDFVNEVEPINLGRFQVQSTRTKEHEHKNDLGVGWNHALNGSTRQVPASSQWIDYVEGAGGGGGDGVGYARRISGETLTSQDTNHKHGMTGGVKGIIDADNSEVRPSSYGVNYIIKEEYLKTYKNEKNTTYFMFVYGN